jgi:hypothetical protein
MKAILAAFTLAIKELKTKANSALEGMGPVDQYEGAREVSYAINTLKYAAKEVESMLNQVAEIEAKLEPEITAAAEARLPEMLAAKVAAGEYIAKADVEAAVAAARTEATTAAEAAFTLREQEAATIAARRKEIETAHGADVAASVTDESLKGDAFDALKTELGRRVAALSEIGVTATANKDAFAKIACGHSFDEDGGKSFDENLALVKGLVPKGAAQAAASTAPAKVPGSGQPPVTNTPAKTGSTVFGF